MRGRLMATGIMGILVAFSLFMPGVRAPPGSELDIIAPLEFNTETVTPPAHVWTPGGSGEDEPEEKPKPPVPIYKWTIETERSWLEDAVIMLALAGLFSFLFLIFYARRQKNGIKGVLKRFRRNPPEVEV